MNRRLLEAQESWKRKDYQTAIETLESVNRLAPSNPDVLMALGQTNARRYNYDAAGRWFEKALRVTHRKTPLLMTIGELCKNLRNLDLARFQIDGVPDILRNAPALGRGRPGVVFGAPAGFVMRPPPIRHHVARTGAGWTSGYCLSRGNECFFRGCPRFA